MRSGKGFWIVAIIVLVALGMGIASWPLLRIRRKGQIEVTLRRLDRLASSCSEFSIRHRRPPTSLRELSLNPDDLVDAWGRPFQFKLLEHRPGDCLLWSLGPNGEDSADDIAIQLNRP